MTEEPLMYPFINATKRYQSIFLQKTGELDLERYHYLLVLINDYEEKLTQQEIADILKIDKSFMVSIVDYLSGKGYVKRQKSSEDKRAFIIKLTGAGKDAVPGIKEAVINVNKRAIEGLSEAQVELFKEVLTKIQMNLAEKAPFDLRINIKKFK